MTLLLRQICLIALVPAVMASCSNAGRSSAAHRKVNTLAAQKYGAPFDVISNPNNTFILCIKHEKETIPLRPIRFFLYDVQEDSVIYEREVDNGTVEWLHPLQLSIKHIPGNVTGHEPPDAFTEVYDIPLRKILTR